MELDPGVVLITISLIDFKVELILLEGDGLLELIEIAFEIANAGNKTEPVLQDGEDVFGASDEEDGEEESDCDGGK
jgi:hypothetical protein